MHDTVEKRDIIILIIVFTKKYWKGGIQVKVDPIKIPHLK